MAGFAGYVSLGYSVFIGIGAYTAGILADGGASHRSSSRRWEVWRRRSWRSCSAWQHRRARGTAFVIVSFAMLELLGLVVRNWSSVTGGSQGFLMPLPSWDVRRYAWPFYYALFMLLLVTMAMSLWIRRSKFGLGLFAIRDDEDKAAGIGVVTPVYKSLALHRQCRAGRSRRCRLRLLPQLPDRQCDVRHRAEHAGCSGGAAWWQGNGVGTRPRCRAHRAALPSTRIRRLGAPTPERSGSSCSADCCWQSCCCCPTASCRRSPTCIDGCGGWRSAPGRLPARRRDPPRSTCGAAL